MNIENFNLSSFAQTHIKQELYMQLQILPVFCKKPSFTLFALCWHNHRPW